MKKKEKKFATYYTQDKHDFVKSLVDQGESVTTSVAKMCEAFDIPFQENVNRNYRKRFQPKVAKSEDQSDELQTAKLKQYDSSKKRFIFSWCQQESGINEQFLTNIEAYANHIDADIHIIAGRYKNSTSLEGSKKQQKAEKDKSQWHPRVIPYLDANRQNIHKYLTVLGDVKIQPTAVTPLTGFNGMTALESCIIGHPAIHLKCLPVLDGYPNKLLLTTGAVSLENYSDTKAGAKGSFNHTLGFVIVELDGDVFHVRQVQCSEDGSFYDLIFKVKDGKVGEYAESCPAIIFGDLHLTQEDEEAVRVSFEMADWSGAEKIILHDVMDSGSISHHELNNPVALAKREDNGTDSLKSELTYVTSWFEKYSAYSFVSVMSNHCAWIDRWVMTNDWRKSPNRSLYLELANAVVSGQAPKGLLPYILDKHTNNVESTGYNDSYRIGDWECGLHGDYGSGGSRGSVMQFKNLNTKTIVGHSHTPARELGCIQVGTLTKLRLSYNAGLNSWLHSNAIIYPNGKASHIHIIKGKYSTLI